MRKRLTGVTTEVSPPTGYLAVLTHPIGGRLVVAKVVSELGDYTGLSALLLLTYSSTGSAFGTATVYAAYSLPALLVATVFSGRLDRPSRRTALVGLAVAGGVVLALPLAFPNALAAIVAASVLGGIRAAYRGVHTAVIAESVPVSLRLPLFGLSATAHLSAQVIGLAGGAGLTMAIGVRWALTADIASFALTAAVLATLPIAGEHARRPRSPASYGFRIIWAQPTLRVLALTTWATCTCSALPETVAPQVATGPWLPVVLASSAAGGALCTFAVARRRFLDDVANQFRLAAGLGLALMAGAGLLLTSAPVWAIALVNALIGAGGGWITGAQFTFTKLAPAEHMAQVEATMVASNIVSSGVGIFLLGGLVMVTTPGAAYLAAGALVLPVAVTAAHRHRSSGRHADRRSRPVQHTSG